MSNSTNPSDITTRHGISDGAAEVIAATPAATDTATVST